MPAKSKAQQRFMGMVYALKSGKIKPSDLPAGVASRVKSVAKSMTAKSAKDFAETKTKKLPSHVKENAEQTIDLSFTLKEAYELIELLNALDEKDGAIIDRLIAEASMTKAERSALAKRAKRGEDIGKPGKKFEEIAKSAAKRYGSEEAGKRVAAAAMWKHAGK